MPKSTNSARRVCGSIPRGRDGGNNSLSRPSDEALRLYNWAVYRYRTNTREGRDSAVMPDWPEEENTEVNTAPESSEPDDDECEDYDPDDE